MESITLTPVESSTIKSIGHDGKDLYVEFRSNHIYKYPDVPSELFESFKTAESKGKFINESIKNKFKYERLT